MSAACVEGARLLETAIGPGPWRWRLLAPPAEGRELFEFRSPGGDRVFGKRYPDDTGAHAYRAASAVAVAAEVCGARTLRVTAPILYDPELRLLLQRPVPGARLDGGDLPASTMIAAGRALRELHALAITQFEHKDLAHHVDELIRPHPNRLAEHVPRYRDVIRRAMRLFEDASPARDANAAPLHRDFHLRQLFDDGAMVWVIDWDCFALGDPAFDVAYFTTYLETHYDPPRAAAAGASFLAGYFDGLAPEGFAERTRVYAAFNFLRRACRRFRLKDSRWELEMNAMLARLAVVVA